MWEVRSQGGPSEEQEAAKLCQRTLERGLGQTELLGEVDIKQVL